MAYPVPLRSMNAELNEGSTDGTYKKVLNNIGNASPATVRARMDLNDIWYGIHEAPVKVTPDGRIVRTPNFISTPALGGYR
jgi:hypothetical protein